jgi:hypothetical protein
MVLNDMASESGLQQDLTIYGSEVTAGDIRKQAEFDTQKAGMQSSIYRANAQLERAMGDWSAASLKAGGAALEAAGNTAADTTLFSGLARFADRGSQLLGGISFGGGSDPLGASGDAAAQNAVATYGTVDMGGVRLAGSGPPADLPSSGAGGMTVY